MDSAKSVDTVKYMNENKFVFIYRINVRKSVSSSKTK